MPSYENELLKEFKKEWEKVFERHKDLLPCFKQQSNRHESLVFILKRPYDDAVAHAANELFENWPHDDFDGQLSTDISVFFTEMEKPDVKLKYINEAIAMGKRLSGREE